MTDKKDMEVDLDTGTINIPTVGTIDIQIIIDAYERIKQREGIAAALAEGKHIGRPANVPDDFVEYNNKVVDGFISVPEAIKQLNISRAKFYRLKKKHEEGQL
jgi:hypothetical protein